MCSSHQAAPSLRFFATNDAPGRDFTISITGDVLRIGRDLPNQPGYLNLELPTISRNHALIVRTQQSYELRDWNSANGTGLFAQQIRNPTAGLTDVIPACPLLHGDVLRFPDYDEHPHYKCVFVYPHGTYTPPLLLQRGAVFIHGTKSRIGGNAAELLSFLYAKNGKVCSYDDLIAHLWPETWRLIVSMTFSKADRQQQWQARRANIDVLATNIRNEIRRLTQRDVAWIRTMRGVGYQLVVEQVSAI